MPGNSQYHQRAMEEAGLCSFRLHWPLATHLSLYTYRHVANCCTNKGKEVAQPSPLRKETLGNTKELERKCVCPLLFFFSWLEGITVACDFPGYRAAIAFLPKGQAIGKGRGHPWECLCC